MTRHYSLARSSYVLLQRLEAAGLVVGSLELSDDGKAMKFYGVSDFDLHLTATVLAEAAASRVAGDASVVASELADIDPAVVPRPGDPFAQQMGEGIEGSFNNV